MPFKWGWGGQEVPDGVSKSLMVFHWSCLTTFVKGSPSRNGSNSVNIGVSLYPPNGVVEDRRFLMVVLSPGAGLEDGFRLLQTSKRPLLGWEIVNLPMVEKFGTWPFLTSCTRMRARTHTHTPLALCGHVFRLLQTSKRPILGWEPLVEKFGTWPFLTSYARMRARTHTHTHPKHMPTLWACV